MSIPLHLAFQKRFGNSGKTILDIKAKHRKKYYEKTAAVKRLKNTHSSNTKTTFVATLIVLAA